MRLDKVEWGSISTDFEVLPDGDYRCEITEIKESKSESSPPKDKLQFELTVLEPAEHAGRKIFDFLTMQTNKGEVNKVSYGRVKAYAEATIGGDRLESDDFDTKELQGHTVGIVLEIDSYEKDLPNGTKKNVPVNRVKKVLKA